MSASPSDYAVLPPRTLVPDIYMFTVTVSKGNLSSEASMEVGLGLGRYLTIIITHQCYPGGDHHRQPAHHPSALQRRYNPDQGITVNGESGILSEDNRQSVQIQFIVQCGLAQCSVCLYDDEKGFLLSWQLDIRHVTLSAHCTGAHSLAVEPVVYW